MNYIERIQKIKEDIEVINKALEPILPSFENIDKSKVIDIMTELEIANRLLLYEFENTPIKNILDKKELIDFFIGELSKYQNRIGGSTIEDPIWIVKYHPEKVRFKLKENSAIIYNTVSIDDMHNKDLYEFSHKMLNHIRKFTNDSDVTLKIIKDDHNEIIWIAYVFK